MTDGAPIEAGRFVGERGPVPISPATAHHEAGHAMACEHFGLGWIIHAPNDEENFMGQTQAVRLGPPLAKADFTLEDVVVIAMSGWAAECHYLGNWEDPYVREGAQHDFDVLDELDEALREPVTERAKALVSTNWERVTVIADAMLQRFG